MNDNISPLVSVLMPVYNAGPFLATAVQSILSQTLSNYEFIIVDDGSTDGSVAVLRSYERADARIRLTIRENRGIPYTRNQLISLARGRYIAWMDSDDISLPLRLEAMTSWMDAHPDHVALGSKTMLIDSSGWEICVWNSPADHSGIDSWHISGKGGAIVFPSSVMIRDAVLSVGGFNEDLTGAEDLDLFLRLAEKAKIANIDTLLFKYRQHAKSISYTHMENLQKDNSKVVARACMRRGLPVPADVSLPFSDSEVAGTHTKWSWWALEEGRVRTARKHALLGVMHSPFNYEGWKALLCSIRGH